MTLAVLYYDAPREHGANFHNFRPTAGDSDSDSYAEAEAAATVTARPGRTEAGDNLNLPVLSQQAFQDLKSM